MNISRISVISQSSERDFAQVSSESSFSNINFSFNLTPCENRPWPYEITLHSEIVNGDDDSKKESPFFTSDLRYAVQFDEALSDGSIPMALSCAWPYMREGLIRQLQWHDFPAAAIVPFTMTFTKE